MAALGVILIIAGAVLAFGIDAAVEGADLRVIGLIVMAGGLIALIVGIAQGRGSGSMRSRKMRTERHVSADGRHVVDESEVR